MTKSIILCINPEPASWTLRQSPGCDSPNVSSQSFREAAGLGLLSSVLESERAGDPLSPPRLPRATSEVGRSLEPLPLARFQKKRWGPWAPLGGAQNAHLLAVANGGSQDAQLSKTGLWGVLSFQ